MITEYASNSKKSKVAEQDTTQEREKAAKIVSGKVSKKKKTTVAKLADVFLPGDITDVRKHIFMDVLVPALKNLALSVINDGASMLITGDVKKGNSSGSKISYNTIFNGRNVAGGTSAVKYQSRTVYDYDNIVFESSGEANLVLDQLEEHISKYGEVTVGDLYDMVGLIPEHTDYNYGWKDVVHSTVVGTRDGYIIRLPKAIALKR